MYSRFDPFLVVLSIVVAIAAGYVALDLAGRVAASRGRFRIAWLVGGALAMGIGIWSMHFIGMLAFRLYADAGGDAPLPMMYDVPRLVLSMTVAFGASLLALAVVGQERLPGIPHVIAALALGAAIAGMHYIGMAGLHVPATVRHDPPLVLVSVLIALLASYVALWLGFHLRDAESAQGHARRVGAAVVIGIGISGMHYTAMNAARFEGYDATRVFDQGAVLATDGLGWAVTGTTLSVLALALLGTAIDRALRARLRLVQQLEETNVELQRAVAAAEQGSQAKSTFLATMSHELRTPLNAFSGYLQLMEMEVAGPLTAEQKAYLTRMQASSRHLTGLINDVLDLAKIESGQLVVRSGNVHVSTVMDAALSLTRPQIESAGLRVSEQCAIDPGATFIGDEDRVRQILVNLLSNAVKFNTAGGWIGLDCGVADAPDTEAKLKGAGPWAYVRVRDAGAGIPADRLEAIFEAFTQLDSSHARRAGGTGLGLTISRQLARQMGGDLTVRSMPGEGSTFTLWLRAAAGAPTRPTPVVTAEAVDDPGPLQPRRLPGLARVGDALMRNGPDILARFADRLRRDARFPGAASLKHSQLVDHYTALLGDIGISLTSLEERGGVPSVHLVDSTDIQRVISELHGVQRMQLGWDEAALRHEHQLMREELARAVRASLPGGDDAGDTAERVVARFMDQAEETSVKALRGARDRETARQPRSQEVTGE